MKFEDFIKNKLARKARPDLQLAKSLIKTSGKHIAFLERSVVDEASAQSVMVMYYEALREVVEAIASKKGYKVYSHEAFTYFLKELGEQLMAQKFDRYRKIRNGINYYGNEVSAAETLSAKEEVKKLIIALKERFLSDIG